MNRHEAREAVFTLIFEMAFNMDTDPADIYKLSVENREIEDNEYIKKVYNGVIDKFTELDAKIEESAVGWKLERMSKVSLSIMRLSVYEMLYVDDVPYSVAMNEAVELAKKFDHDDAPAFINGVLNNIADREGIKEQ